MENLPQLNPYYDNNPLIYKSIDEWKALFVTLNSREEAASEDLVEKVMDFSAQRATMLLIRTPSNTKKMTQKTDNLKLDGASITSFDILLEQQDSILEVQK